MQTRGGHSFSGPPRYLLQCAFIPSRFLGPLHLRKLDSALLVARAAARPFVSMSSGSGAGGTLNAGTLLRAIPGGA